MAHDPVFVPDPGAINADLNVDFLMGLNGRYLGTDPNGAVHMMMRSRHVAIPSDVVRLPVDHFEVIARDLMMPPPSPRTREATRVVATPDVSVTTFSNKTRSLFDKECSICCEAYVSNNKLSTLGCNHTFHKRCLDRWARRSNQCPLCRAIFRRPNMRTAC